MINKQIIIRSIAVPLTLLIAFILFIAIYRLTCLPSNEELINFAPKYYSQYGFWLVFCAALVEGVLLVNWYLPSSFVIVLGVTFSRENPLRVVIVVSLVILGFLLAYILDYLMGRYGWYRLFLHFGLGSPLERMKKRLKNMDCR